MSKYYLRLIGPGARGSRVSGALLRDLLSVLVDGSRKAVRLRVDGKSEGPGRLPAWVGRAAEFDVVGLRQGSTVLELDAPTLGEVAADRIAQEDMFEPLSADASSLGLFRDSLAEALEGKAESDRFDPGLLDTIDGIGKVFGYGIEAIELQNAKGGVTRIAQPQLETAKRLRRETPPPQRVRVTGWLDAIRHSDRMFTLKLEDGATLRGIAEGLDPEVLRSLFGRKATVSALAVFRPSGKVLRLEADHIAPAGDDFSAWSREPHPLFADEGEAALRVAQGSRSGLSALIGQWPGDESDEEISDALEELS